jgi:WD40 repeat protein
MGRRRRQVRPRFTGHKRAVKRLTFLPEGKQVLSWSEHEGTYRLWDIKTGEEVWVIQAFKGKILCGGLSPDGKLLLTWGYTKQPEDAELQLWDVATGKLERSFEAGNFGVRSIHLSPNNRFAILECFPFASSVIKLNPGLRVWDITAGKVARTFDMRKEGWSAAATFSPDSKLLLLDRIVPGSKKKAQLILWDLLADKEVRMFDMRGPGVFPVEVTHGHALASAFSPDGKRIVTADADWVVRLWDVTSGKEVWSGEKISQPVSFSSDGKQLSSTAQCVILDYAAQIAYLAWSS